MFKFPNGHTILHTGEIFTDRALCYNFPLLPFLRLFSHCQEIQTKLVTANSSSWQIHFHKNHQLFDFQCTGFVYYFSAVYVHADDENYM